MSNIERVIFKLFGGRDDGMVYDSRSGDSHSSVCARGVWAVTQGEIGKVFLGHSKEFTERLVSGDVDARYHKYKITERHDDGDTVTLRADFVGVYDPNSEQA